ncbi:MAG TPA: TIGR00366 family protein [Gemmatimonadales bacterium]
MTSPASGPSPADPPTDRLSRVAALLGRLIPDALTTSIALLALVFGVALVMGNPLAGTMDAYYRGLWMLLPFTMQMTLILVLSGTLGATPTFRRLVVALSRIPRSSTQVLGLAILVTAGLSYLYWGLGLALGPMVAIHFAREAEAKGLAVDFPFLLAVVGAALSVWQFGLSASAPLLMNTPGHFLESTTGLMPLRTTIFSPAALAFVALFLLVLFGSARIMSPRRPTPISSFPDSFRLAEPLRPADPEPGTRPLEAVPSLSERIEGHSVPALLLGAALAGWIFYHFAVKGGGLELNSLNTVLLLFCLVLHRNVRNFSKGLQQAVLSVWPVVVLYHLYAGVAGLIQFTSVGENFAAFFGGLSTGLTFPLLTALSAAVVSVFVPSSGGQWVIQGFITAKTAAAVGVTAQRGLLALSIGDHVGNLISPFWVVIAAGIARIDFRRFIGFNLAFAAIWFGLGVLVFTFLPV